MEEKHQMLMTPEFVFFWHGPFSQWHPSPFTHNGTNFANAEQWMMFRKATLFDDDLIAEQIMRTSSPAECKRLGRQIKDFDENVWREHRLAIVTKGSLEKFRQNKDLKQILMNTGGRILVEATPYDDIWGIAMAANARGVENPSHWKGLNLLGIALMTARYIIASEEIVKTIPSSPIDG